ncbi:MAG: hypothetical protein EXQ70_02075 [Solirubrobacterales bacterium]|nr:hypothetical protein [Solirubrobacterales bacterium]
MVESDLVAAASAAEDRLAGNPIEGVQLVGPPAALEAIYAAPSAQRVAAGVPLELVAALAAKEDVDAAAADQGRANVDGQKQPGSSVLIVAPSSWKRITGTKKKLLDTSMSLTSPAFAM